jgi:hypothetical protein
MLNDFAQTIADGLKRNSVKTVTRYAELYRIMGPPIEGNWSYKYHPWVVGIQDDVCQKKSIQKAAQMGITEVALNVAFKYNDIDRQHVLYALPSKTPDASDFSAARFDQALLLSDHLNNLYTQTKNVGHKVTNAGVSLYIRGSRSRSQFKSIPAPIIILDELDEMVQENINMVFERAAGQFFKVFLLLSTPTIKNFGINSHFRQGTQSHFMFKCPHCNRTTELLFPECLKITAEKPEDPKIRNTYIFCKECKAKLDHEEKVNFLKDGFWVDTYTDRMDKSYWINQLYSMTLKPWEFALSYLNSFKTLTDEQEFWNSKVGKTHTVKGAKINDEDLDNAKGEYRTYLEVKDPGLIVIGIDVGTWLHFEITRYFFSKGNISDINNLTDAKVLYADKVKNFYDLDSLIKNYRVIFLVVDANPERRKSLELCKKYPNNSRMCFFGNNLRGSNKINDKGNEELSVTVDRTMWCDLAYGRFFKGKIKLPFDISREYQEHLKEPTRVYEKDKDGNPVGRWLSIDADHFAFARVYNEIALPLSAKMLQNQNISGVL